MDYEDFSEGLAVLEALEALPERPKTSSERVRKKRRKDRRKQHQFEWVEFYNRAAAQYGSDVAYHLAKAADGNIFAVYAAVGLIQRDLNLWFEATGRRVSELRSAERLGLECWRWETHHRQRQQHAAWVIAGEIAIPIWRRVPERPLHERPDEELSVRGWVRGSNLAEEKTLRHLSRPEGLVAQLQAEHEHDRLGNRWDTIEAVFKFRKALGRSLRSTRD